MTFHDGTIQERTTEFESHVSCASLLLFPVLIGLFLICGLPYLRWLISVITRKAIYGKARMDALTLKAAENATLDEQIETNKKRRKIAQQEQDLVDVANTGSTLRAQMEDSDTSRPPSGISDKWIEGGAWAEQISVKGIEEARNLEAKLEKNVLIIFQMKLPR
ncbi:MAG: hypothetical protein OXC63_13035 [Aestuariivita sp.]|nr:hypothetical protein [Aestuariivita sp.]MCY4347295.1 hypothetical protein [Aestuariivita sp.]